jgi:hypothetical protein
MDRELGIIIVVVIIAIVIDALWVDPFFQSLTAGTSTHGWNPLTVLLFFHMLPLAGSLALVRGVLSSLSGRGRR